METWLSIKFHTRKINKDICRYSTVTLDFNPTFLRAVSTYFHSMFDFEHKMWAEEEKTIASLCFLLCIWIIILDGLPSILHVILHVKSTQVELQNTVLHPPTDKNESCRSCLGEFQIQFWKHIQITSIWMDRFLIKKAFLWQSENSQDDFV